MGRCFSCRFRPPFRPGVPTGHSRYRDISLTRTGCIFFSILVYPRHACGFSRASMGSPVRIYSDASTSLRPSIACPVVPFLSTNEQTGHGVHHGSDRPVRVSIILLHFLNIPCYILLTGFLAKPGRALPAHFCHFCLPFGDLGWDRERTGGAWVRSKDLTTIIGALTGFWNQKPKSSGPQGPPSVSFFSVFSVLSCSVFFHTVDRGKETRGNPNSPAFKPRLFSRKKILSFFSFLTLQPRVEYIGGPAWIGRVEEDRFKNTNKKRHKKNGRLSVF